MEIAKMVKPRPGKERISIVCDVAKIETNIKKSDKVITAHN